MTERALATTDRTQGFARHGWVGLALIAVFWPLNWFLPGMRTLWAFFPLWLGYCLTVDALTLRRRGSSLLSRSAWRYIGLFLISAPAWWIFEVINNRIQNWNYLGTSNIYDPHNIVFATINFSVVVPAVFGAAEWIAGSQLIRRLKPGPQIYPTRAVTSGIFVAGLAMLALMITWPRIFFPFAWLSVLFILEPVNIWLGNVSLLHWLARRDWRPVISLFCGALVTGFFWELWNYFSFPKWTYTVPGVDFLHIFEMPLLGYGGYLPFALELLALYHLVVGVLGRKQEDYLRLDGA